MSSRSSYLMTLSIGSLRPSRASILLTRGGHSHFIQNLEKADIPGSRRMGPSTELPAEVGDHHDPHLFTVFLTKKSHRSHLEGFLHRHDLCIDASDSHESSDSTRDSMLAKLLLLNRCEMGEVKPQSFRLRPGSQPGGHGLPEPLSAQPASRWVAVWLRAVALRRIGSTRRLASIPSCTIPLLTLA